MNVLKLREALSKEIGCMAIAKLEGKSVDGCVSLLTEKVQNLCGELRNGKCVGRQKPGGFLNYSSSVNTSWLQEGGTDVV